MRVSSHAALCPKFSIVSVNENTLPRVYVDAVVQLTAQILEPNVRHWSFAVVCFRLSLIFVSYVRTPRYQQSEIQPHPCVILDALIRGGRLSMDRYRACTLIGGVVLILL